MPLFAGARNRVEYFVGQMDVAFVLFQNDRIEAAKMIAEQMKTLLDSPTAMVRPEDYANELPEYSRAVGRMDAILSF